MTKDIEKLIEKTQYALEYFEKITEKYYKKTGKCMKSLELPYWIHTHLGLNIGLKAGFSIFQQGKPFTMTTIYGDVKVIAIINSVS